MIFEAVELIEAPIEDVFSTVADFKSFRGSKTLRGVRISSHDQNAPFRNVPSWDVTFMFRGSERKLKVEIGKMEYPKSISATAMGKELVGEFRIEFSSVTSRCTGVLVRLDLRPKTVFARAIIGYLRLRYDRFDALFQRRVEKYTELVKGLCRSKAL